MLKVAGGGGGATGAVVYKGTWNANANSPALTSSVGTQGDYYVVNVAGTTNLNGITDWQIGDWAIFNGSVWQKVDNTDAVTSVNGQTGTVVLTAANVGATPNTTYVLAGTALSGGGQLTGNVTLSLANTAVTAGTYGNATAVSQITIDGQGRITNAANVGISIASGNVTGLGTMATQNANSVVITGGTINSVTFATATISSGNATLTTSNVTTENVTYANVATAIRTQSLTGYLYGNANTGNVSASTTIPNSGLGNSTATIGNTTITLGSTTTSIGNLTLAGANISATSNANATFVTSSLPLVPEGYITILINGTNKKIPYYGV